MSNLKRLDLDSWMDPVWEVWVEGRDELLEKSYVPVPPAIGIPGIYLQRKICWFELKDGRAFKFEEEMFRYKLGLLVAQELNDRQANALRQVVDQRLATKKQRNLLYAWENARDLRKTGRQAQLSYSRILKTLET